MSLQFLSPWSVSQRLCLGVPGWLWVCESWEPVGVVCSSWRDIPLTCHSWSFLSLKFALFHSNIILGFLGFVIVWHPLSGFPSPASPKPILGSVSLYVRGLWFCPSQMYFLEARASPWEFLKYLDFLLSYFVFCLSPAMLFFYVFIFNQVFLFFLFVFLLHSVSTIVVITLNSNMCQSVFSLLTWTLITSSSVLLFLPRILVLPGFYAHPTGPDYSCSFIQSVLVRFACMCPSFFAVFPSCLFFLHLDSVYFFVKCAPWVLQKGCGQSSFAWGSLCATLCPEQQYGWVQRSGCGDRGWHLLSAWEGGMHLHFFWLLLPREVRPVGWPPVFSLRPSPRLWFLQLCLDVLCPGARLSLPASFCWELLVRESKGALYVSALLETSLLIISWDGCLFLILCPFF